MLHITLPILWRSLWLDSRYCYMLLITLPTSLILTHYITYILEVTLHPSLIQGSAICYSLHFLQNRCHSDMIDSVAKCYSLLYVHYGGHSDLIHGLPDVTHYITNIMEVTPTWFTGCYMLLITLPTLWRSLSPVSNSQGCYNYATHYFTKLTHVFCDIIRGAAICYSLDYIRYGGPSDLIHGAVICYSLHNLQNKCHSDLIAGAAKCYSLHYLHYGGHSDLIHGAEIMLLVTLIFVLITDQSSV